MSFLRSFIRRFARDEKGSLVVEAVIVMPLFVWAYAGLFVYWDAYRSVNTVQKASYAISDLISRSQNSVNDTYLAGMATTFNRIAGSGTAGQIRVTSYTWSALRNRYEVIFSRIAGGNAVTQTTPNFVALTTANLANLTTHLPIMSDGDSAILIETSVPYTPPVSYGLEPATIDEFIVTRPRFLPKLCHTNFSC